MRPGPSISRGSVQGGVFVGRTSYAGKVNAPEFPAGLDWLNTERPVTLEELRGKLMILDFWTYC